MRALSPVFVSTAALLFVGCGAGPFGIWMLEIPSATDDDQECTDGVTHNFTDATVVEDNSSSDYTSELTQQRSNSLVLVRIEAIGEGQAVMIVGSEAFPGTETGEGSWSFAWTGSQVTDQLDEHVQGYSYTWSGSSEVTETFFLTVTKDTLTGTYTLDSFSDDAYTESDSWSDQVAKIVGSGGLIPASRHLTVPGPKADMPASNRFDESDCDADTCELSVSSDCSASLDFTGTLTAFTEDEAYDAVGGAGQNPGI